MVVQLNAVLSIIQVSLGKRMKTYVKYVEYSLPIFKSLMYERDPLRYNSVVCGYGGL